MHCNSRSVRLDKCGHLRLLWVGLLLAGTIFSFRATAQNLEFRTEDFRYKATRFETPPTIDGDLSDPVWQAMEAIDQLVQQVPDHGSPATEKTLVRIGYDADAIYIAAYCYDSEPSKIVRNLLSFRDDSVWSKDDVIRVGLDTFHDHRRAYVFSVNSLGTKQDTQVDNRTWNPDWDEVWDVRSRLQKDGWSVEMRIPFRILRFPTAEGAVWGLNFVRIIKRKNEFAYWSPIRPGDSLSQPEFYGHLEGISRNEPGRNIQITPYGLVGAERAPGNDTIDSEFEVGADAKMSLTSALTLDLTYNTNFAQVEVDDEQVNLTRFSLFFPEKRDFFLESAQLFNFGLNQQTQIFFSRRIGLAGGEPVPILGGARLTGRAGAFDLALLSTQTDSHPGGPTANWSASRVRWNLGQRSYIGGIFTSVASSDLRNQVIGPDALFWLGRNLRAEGFLAVVEDRELEGNPSSYSGAVIYDQDLWEVNLRSSFVDDEFNPAMGFVRRQDYYQQQGRLRRGFRLNRPWMRKLDFSGDLAYYTDQDGNLETREWTLEARNELNSGDLISFQFESNSDLIKIEDGPFVINRREGITIPFGNYQFSRWSLNYQGFQGRTFVGGAELSGGDFYGGQRRVLNFSGTWRPSPHLFFLGDYEFNDIDLPQGDFAAHLVRTRVQIPFTPRTNINAFLQYNSLEKELSSQFRFHLLYGRDSDIFLVFTDRRVDLDNGLRERDWALQLKITYRFYM